MTKLMAQAKPLANTPRESASDGSAASSAPTDPIDFYVASGPLTTYGLADPLTGVVTKGDYPAADLAKLIGSPDFMKEVASMPRPVIEVTASSTEQDLQGDIMYLSALTDMVEVDPNLSIFLNHSYQEPEDRYGKLAGAPFLKSQSGVTDVGERISVEILNPRAALSYVYTTRGAKVGVSGGFMVTEAEYIDPKTGQPVDPDDIDLWDVLMGAVTLGIKHVRKVEDSIVGIPANQRSWVENAAKGLFTRTHDPKLAPIVKALWPTQYNTLLQGIADPALRQQLREIEPRQQKTASRLFWVPDGDSFMLVRGQGQTSQKRALTRAEVADVLKGAPVAGTPVADDAPVGDANGTPEMQPLGADVTALVMSGEPLTASGDSAISPDGTPDLTLAANDDDKQAQEARSKKCGIGIKDGGSVTCPSEYESFADKMAWWGDYTNYKYPLDTKAHADNAASRWGDADNRKGYTSDEQDIIGKAITKRQESFGEEPKDDKGETKAAGPDVTADATPDVTASADVVADPVPAPVADLAELVTKAADDAPPAAADVSVAADGTHAKCTGPHVHGHKAMGSQGGDESHKHEHTHNGDANHDHHGASDSAKAAEPVVAEPVVMVAPVAPTVPAVPDAQRAALLASYNGIGKLLGFTDALPDGRDTGKRADGQPDLVKCDRWDDATAEAIAAGIAAVDAASDALMRVAGVPDMDDFGGPGDGDGLGDPQNEPAPPPSPNYVLPASRRVTSADLLVMSSRLAKYALAFVTKEGKRHSAADLDALQTIHDSVVALTDGMCCKAEANPQPNETQPPADPSDPDDTPSTGAPDNSDMQAARAGMATGKAALDALTKSYEAAVKAISDTSAIEARAVAVAAQVKTLETTLATMNAEKDMIGADLEQYSLNLAKYTGVSLGRPTRQQVNRSFAADPNAVAMPVTAPALPAPAHAPIAVSAATLGEPLTDATRAALLAQTSVQYTEGVGNLRVWPDGVGKGQRPALSDGQRYVLNVITDGDALRASYEAGGPARIPIVNDGE